MIQMSTATIQTYEAIVCVVLILTNTKRCDEPCQSPRLKNVEKLKSEPENLYNYV